jgi:hypothetical protein
MSTKLNINAIPEGSISVEKFNTTFHEITQEKLISGENIKTINGESILGKGDITIEAGSSEANVQAVDIGDVVDDVIIDYATTAYVDGLVGDINSVLESIINGGAAAKIITFEIIGTEYEAEEGMTFGQWMLSDYYVLGTFNNDTSYINSLKNNPYFDIELRCGVNGYIGADYDPSITIRSVIIPNINYKIPLSGGGTN